MMSVMFKVWDDSDPSLPVIETVIKITNQERTWMNFIGTWANRVRTSLKLLINDL